MNAQVNRIDLLILADWLPPDFGAVGQYALQFAEAAADSGQTVCLVGFSTGEGSVAVQEIGRGALTTIRVSRPAYDRTDIIRRALWTLTANLSLLWAARSVLRRSAEIIFTGSPPYLLHFIAPIKWLLKGRVRYRIADFHPECLIATRPQKSWFLSALETVTWFWRRRMDVMEIISEDQRRRLLDHGIKPERITLRRDVSPVSFEGALPADRPEALTGRMVILYSGNWGVAHDADTFVQGLAQLSPSDRQRVGVWLNATGARVEAVRDAARALGIAVAHTPPCALARLPSVLLAADLHLICLANAFVGLVLPSKVYACIDSGRPILFVGSADSDVHTLISQAERQPYWRAEVTDASAVAAAIRACLDPSP